MKILFINPAGGLGGAERVLLDTMRSLRELAPEVRVELLLLASGPLEEQARKHQVLVHLLPLPDQLNTFGDSSVTLRELAAQSPRTPELLFAIGRFARRFREAVRSIQPDVLHTNGMKAHMLAAALTPRYATVVHNHDFVGDRKVSRWLLRTIQRRDLVVIANSRAVAEDTRLVMPRTRVTTVYNAVDIEEFTPGAKDPAYLANLARLGPPPANCVSIGMVSTFARWKGHPVFIEAARRLSSRSSVPLRFYITGGPIYTTRGSQFSEGELKGLAGELYTSGSLGFIPFRPDVARVHRALDIFVHPSTAREPFGKSIVEAMASGTAAVVARSGGARELFTDGETALGFEPGNVEDLVQRLKQLVDDAALRAGLATAGRSVARERFALPRFGREMIAVYETLVDETGRSSRDAGDPGMRPLS